MKKFLSFMILGSAISVLAIPAEFARIDVRNENAAGKIAITDKAGAVRAEITNWQPSGVFLQFKAGTEWKESKFELKVSGDSPMIEFALRGPDVRDSSGKRLEHNTEFSYLKVNDKVLLDAEKDGKTATTWHDRPIKKSYGAVKDGDILTVTVKYRSAAE